MTLLLDRAVELLREAEWAARVWTDYAACPWCGGFYDQVLPVIPGKYEAQPSGHRSECRYVEFMRAVDA